MPRNENPRLVYCVVCDKEGYSDEMGSVNDLRMCAQCMFPHIDWTNLK